MQRHKMGREVGLEATSVWDMARGSSRAPQIWAKNGFPIPKLQVRERSRGRQQRRVCEQLCHSEHRPQQGQCDMLCIWLQKIKSHMVKTHGKGPNRKVLNKPEMSAGALQSSHCELKHRTQGPSFTGEGCVRVNPLSAFNSRTASTSRTSTQ